MANDVATQQNAPRVPSILTGMAQTYGVTVAELDETIRATVMDPKSTYAEYLSFLVVAKNYGLNPLTREIFAFPKKGGGIVPLVSIDGWIRIVTSHAEYEGHKWEEQMSEDGKLLVSCTCIMFRKGRAMPTVVTEYFVECKQDTLPWKNMPHRMLRHKAFIQAARYAFGFSGIYDEDEGMAMGEDAGPRRSNRGQAPKPPGTLVPHDPATGEVIDAEAQEVSTGDDGNFGSGSASPENADGDEPDAVKETDPAPPVEQKKAEAKKETPKPAESKAAAKPTPFEELKAMLHAAKDLVALDSIVTKDAKGKPSAGMKLYDKLGEEEVTAIKALYRDMKAKLAPKPAEDQQQPQNESGGEQQDGGAGYDPGETLERIAASYEQCDSVDSLEACQFSLEETLDSLNRSDREKAQVLYEAAEARIKKADAVEAAGAGEQQDGEQQQEAEKDPATMTIDEYMAYAEGYISAATDAKSLNTLWFGEAGIRTETLKIPEKLRDQLRDLRNAKLAEFRSATG